MNPGPKIDLTTEYARELGITRRQVQRLGGADKLKAMPEEGRAILVNQAKGYGKRK